jgi:hypothetical protein
MRHRQLPHLDGATHRIAPVTRDHIPFSYPLLATPAPPARPHISPQFPPRHNNLYAGVYSTPLPPV